MKKSASKIIAYYRQYMPALIICSMFFVSATSWCASLDMVELWRKELKHEYPARRIAALKALGELGIDAKEAVNDMALLLEDENWRVRWDAVDALGRIKPSDVSAIVKLLTSKKSWVRVVAAAALGKIGYGAASAIPALCNNLTDELWEARWYSAYALSNMGDCVIPSIIEVCNNRNKSYTYLAAIYVLNELGAHSKPAIPVLVKFLDDKDYNVRKAAIVALGNVGYEAKESIEILERIEKSDDIWLNSISSWSINKIKKGFQQALK